jgi:hypothetical protein
MILEVLTSDWHPESRSKAGRQHPGAHGELADAGVGLATLFRNGMAADRHEIEWMSTLQTLRPILNFAPRGKVVPQG